MSDLTPAPSVEDVAEAMHRRFDMRLDWCRQLASFAMPLFAPIVAGRDRLAAQVASLVEALRAEEEALQLYVGPWEDSLGLHEQRTRAYAARAHADALRAARLKEHETPNAGGES